MASTALRREERIGLVLALIAHAGLVALLVWRPLSAPVIPPPERMTVTLSEDVALTSTSPEPQSEAAPDIAPDIGEPPAPEPEFVPPPKPEPLAKVKPEPRATPTPPRLSPKPSSSPPRPSASTAGGSRIGSDFLQGVPGARSTGAARNPPAAGTGPAVQSALSGAISRQLKPHWSAPQGADAEKLVTLVRFRLARDGSLVGQPEVVGQTGVTPANEAQKARHAEQAIRAVRLAAPFDLPEEYYSAWQTITSRFDRRLSQ